MMTPAQKNTIKREMDDSVAFPPIYETDGNAVEAMVPTAFIGRGPFAFPNWIEFQLVRIEPDGKVSRRSSAMYFTEVTTRR